jgi:hypothetical protein
MYRLNWYREWWSIWFGLTNWKGLLIGAVFSVPWFCRILVRDPVFVAEELEWEGIREVA